MPKLKTFKAARKRVKVSANGKIVIRKSGKRHLLSSKSGKRKRQLRQQAVLGGKFAKQFRTSLGV